MSGACVFVAVCLKLFGCTYAVLGGFLGVLDATSVLCPSGVTTIPYAES